MLRHYLKIALRNMRRFKLQTIVCLTGLAVGMTCFALGTLWLRYIESFEDFVPDGDNIFLVMSGEGKSPFSNGFYYYTQAGEDETLAKNMPGVKEHCHLIFLPNGEKANERRITVNGQQLQVTAAFADTAYVRMFGIEAEKGSLAHLRDGEMAVTHSAAQRIFGDKPALGQTVRMQQRYGSDDEQDFTIVAVIADRPENSQFRYEVLAYSEAVENPMAPNGYTVFVNACTFVRFAPSVPRDSIVGGKREFDYHFPDGGKRTMGYTFAPITELRNQYPDCTVKIATSYVRWFMSLGLLVILCSLVNYIITMVSHLRRRGWEFSLRRVLGSSRLGIQAMVSLETLILFLFSAALACLLTWLLLPSFREYSGIDIALSAIALRLAIYLAIAIVCGMALSALTAWVVMWKTQRNILSSRQFSPRTGGLRGALGTIIQMTLAMAIIFCAVVMLRQVMMLMYSNELGFSHNDMGVVYTCPEELRQKIEQSPLTAETHACDKAMFPRRMTMYSGGLTKNEADVDNRDTYVGCCDESIHPEMFRFYNMALVSGELPVHDKYKDLSREWYEEDEYQGQPIQVLHTHSVNEIAINETFCRNLGFTPESAIGQSLWAHGEEVRVSGVVKDVYYTGPTSQPEAIQYKPMKEWTGPDLMFHSQPGRVAELCDSIRRWTEQLDKDVADNIDIFNCEQEFEQYIASEQMLIKILLAVGGASLFVCVIGTFSFVSLSLAQRRKEIAIRKVHGARMKDILRLFLKGQILSLLLAALVAYPVAYIIMNHWLEGYAKQITIDWWLIPATFLGIASVVLSTIILKIWRAARESTVAALNS